MLHFGQPCYLCKCSVACCCGIFKNKSDVQSGSNYGGTELLSHAAKIWGRAAEARLREAMISEQQVELSSDRLQTKSERRGSDGSDLQRMNARLEEMRKTSEEVHG